MEQKHKYTLAFWVASTLLYILAALFIFYDYKMQVEHRTFVVLLYVLFVIIPTLTFYQKQIINKNEIDQKESLVNTSNLNNMERWAIVEQSLIFYNEDKASDFISKHNSWDRLTVVKLAD